MATGRLDAAGDVVEVRAGRRTALGEERRAELRDGVRTRRIEALPFQLISPEGSQEGVFAVLRQLGVVAVVPARLRVAHVAESGGEPFADGSVRGRGRLEIAAADDVGDEQDDQERRKQRGEVAPARRDVGRGALVPAAHEAQPTPEQEKPRRDHQHGGEDQREVV